MHVSRRGTGRLLLLAAAVAAIGVSGAQAGSKPERNAEQMAIHWKHEDALYASRQKATQTQTTAAQLRAAHWKHEDALYRAGRSTSGSQRMRSAGGSRASTSDESFAWSDAGIGAVAGVAFALLAGGALLSLRKRGRVVVSTEAASSARS